jgi:hypothetical protein
MGRALKCLHNDLRPSITDSGPKWGGWLIVELASWGIVTSTAQSLAPGCLLLPGGMYVARLHDHARAHDATVINPHTTRYKLKIGPGNEAVFFLRCCGL